MAIEFQCTGCRQWYQVPDRAAGREITCPACSESMLIPEAEEILDAVPMLLDDDDSDEGIDVPFSHSAAEDHDPSAAQFFASLSDSHLDTGPSESVHIDTTGSRKPAVIIEEDEETGIDLEEATLDANTAEPQAPASDIPREVVFDDEATERAVLLSRPALINYIFAGVIVAGLLTITAIVTIQKERRPNPLPIMVGRTISPSPQALAWLGERQSSFLYSFQLPAHFEPSAERPSIKGLPKKTIAHRWQAAGGGNDAGSTFSVWVIPEVYDVEEKLAEMNNLERYLGYPTEISDRSAHAKIGGDMVCVQGMVDGSEYHLSRKGVIYLISHDDRTIMIVAMAVGPSSRQGKAVLNAAAGTIELNSKNENS